MLPLHDVRQTNQSCQHYIVVICHISRKKVRPFDVWYIIMAPLYKPISGQDQFCSDRDHYLWADIRLIVAKIVFVAIEITFKVAVMASLVAKISFVVTDITI